MAKLKTKKMTREEINGKEEKKTKRNHADLINRRLDSRKIELV